MRGKNLGIEDGFDAEMHVVRRERFVVRKTSIRPYREGIRELVFRNLGITNGEFTPEIEGGFVIGQQHGFQDVTRYIGGARI